MQKLIDALVSAELCSQGSQGRSQKDWSLATATGHGMQLATGPTLTSMDEELFAYIGPEQRSLESHLRKKRCKVLFKIRTQLRSGKARCGRVLQQQELISLRAQELELVKEQQLPGRNVLGWRRRVRRGHVSG